MAINRKKQNIKKLLKQYSSQNFKQYEEYLKMPVHSFSDEYEKGMKTLRQRPIPTRPKHTFAYRMAMTFACVIVALLIVNQGSAYFFGITLWDRFMEPAPEEMVTTIYQEKENGRNKKGGEKTARKERVHDIPTEIPEGYELVFEENARQRITVDWKSDNGNQLCFSSIGINQNVHMYDNGEWETEETITVAGYQGKIYAKSTCFYLYWDDAQYRNTIESINISKEQLFTMAESLYYE